ncbi:MAG: Gfo/Idh/MocA family oxidoreductase [Gluconacetobacter diazotrophicus]|nr:Gfo/Idh/MocA family oxidoreductase [Gluconacetobacter diazotrophicus]
MSTAAIRRPRVGFLGVGWIGRHRMAAIRDAGAVEIAAVADSSADALAAALDTAPEARALPDLDALLNHGLDGVVIATPSARHAAESIRALEAGMAVFCQKPLGRTREENAAVVAAAERADRLLGVDLSYRHTAGMRRLRDLVFAGELGTIHAIDLVFHNAYGPDKPWFYDRALSGGGCVIDLGIHLVDLALWILGFPEVVAVNSDLFREGGRLAAGDNAVEDHALATLRVADGAAIRLACSWRAHAGRDADISLSVFGTRGGATFRNTGGSFYDFTLERHDNTRCELLTAPPDAWGGRAATDWADRLAASPRFDPSIEPLLDVARAIDAIYAGGL